MSVNRAVLIREIFHIFGIGSSNTWWHNPQRAGDDTNFIFYSGTHGIANYKTLLNYNGYDGTLVINNLAEKLSGNRSADEELRNYMYHDKNMSYSNLESYLTNFSNLDFRPINDSSIVNNGYTTYISGDFSFNPVLSDALTSDIGAMYYNGERWNAGINWNNTNT